MCDLSKVLFEKIGHCLDTDVKRLLRLIHVAAEVPDIAGKQMGCLAFGRGLEYWPVLDIKSVRVRMSGTTPDQIDVFDDSGKGVPGCRVFYFDIAHGFFHCIDTGTDFPMALIAKLDEKRRFAVGIMRAVNNTLASSSSYA